MTQYAFTEASFQQSLARARAVESENIRQALAGNGPAPSQDIGAMLRRQANERLQKAFSA